MAQALSVDALMSAASRALMMLPSLLEYAAGGGRRRATKSKRRSLQALDSVLSFFVASKVASQSPSVGQARDRLPVRAKDPRQCSFAVLVCGEWGLSPSSRGSWLLIGASAMLDTLTCPALA